MSSRREQEERIAGQNASEIRGEVQREEQVPSDGNFFSQATAPQNVTLGDIMAAIQGMQGQVDALTGKENQLNSRLERRQRYEQDTREKLRAENQGNEKEGTSQVQPPDKEIDRPVNDMMIETFLRLKPPSFTGEKGKENPQNFINEMEKRFTLIECGPLRAVEFTGFKLEDAAAIWYATHIADPVTKRSRVQWQEFQRLFLDKFLSETEIEKRGYEFETLRQENLSVEDYERKFIDLSQYATHLRLTEETKIKRFIKGLSYKLFRSVGFGTYKTFSEAVNAARRFEYREEEERAQEDSKGTRMENRPSRSTRPSGKRGKLPQPYVTMGQRKGKQVVGSEEKPQRETRKWCEHCRRVHRGECLRGTGACFKCGKQGHIARNCPTVVKEVVVHESTEVLSDFST